jgi:hypothetical protein
MQRKLCYDADFYLGIINYNILDTFVRASQVCSNKLNKKRRFWNLIPTNKN